MWLASALFLPLAFSPLYPSPIHDVSPASFRVRGGEGGEIKGQKRCWWCPLGAVRCPDAASSSCGWLSIRDATWGRTVPWPGWPFVTCPHLPCQWWSSQWTLAASSHVHPSQLQGTQVMLPWSLSVRFEAGGRKTLSFKKPSFQFHSCPRPPPGSRWWAKGQEPVWLPFFCTSYTSLLTVGHLFFSPLVLCPKLWDRKCHLKNSITWRIVLHL